jgi:predicted DNA binding CopG/RHH family protein
MKRINIHLSEQQIAALKALAQKTGLRVAEIVRRAVDAYLRREK